MTSRLNTYYNSKSRLFWHLAFWGVYFLYHILIYGIKSGDYTGQLFWESSTLPVKIGATYFLLYFLLPRYFMSRQFIRFFIFGLLLLVAAAILQRAIDFTVVGQWFYPGRYSRSSFFSVKILYTIIEIYPVVALAAFIKIGKRWLERDQESRELQKEKLASELKFLKAQTHPHFLFNTLNNLYALTLKKSEDAPDVVLKLSELLSYVLYECNERTVPLKKELDLVENYISLERIRYGERLQVTFNLDGSLEGKEIPPMLILPFIENSFKHGFSRQLDQVWLDIEITLKEDQFSLKVENSIAVEDEEESNLSFREGIGLANVKRRLELLYGEDHQLDITKETDRYVVVLNLNLNHPLNLSPHES